MPKENNKSEKERKIIKKKTNVYNIYQQLAYY